MKEILDSDEIQETPQREKNLKTKAIVYCILILGSWIFLPLFQTYVLMSVFLGLIVEAIRWLWRRNKPEAERKNANPFWFELIESIFSIWILSVIVFVIGLFILPSF